MQVINNGEDPEVEDKARKQVGGIGCLICTILGILCVGIFIIVSTNVTNDGILGLLAWAGFFAFLGGMLFLGYGRFGKSGQELHWNTHTAFYTSQLYYVAALTVLLFIVSAICKHASV